jgi:hypothetical protein
METPILNNKRFSQYIRLYKRFIDDLFLIWTGPAAVLCEFRHALAMADEEINITSLNKSEQDAENPAVVTAKRHEQTDFLDLDMNLQRVRTRIGMTVLFLPYRKPGNAYAYIPIYMPSEPWSRWVAFLY